MLEEIPLGKKPISYKWIYRTKYNTCGSLNKQKERKIANNFALQRVVQKERQIANGFALQKVVDYEKTYYAKEVGPN